MTDIVARYTLAFNDLASRGILRTARNANLLSRGLGSASRRMAAFSAAVVSAATIANKSTAEQANLAASVGKTVAELQGITGVAKSIGLNFENVIDLQEEVINKFGEMAAAGELPQSAIEGLKGLGFALGEVAGVAERADINELIDRGLQSVASGVRTAAEVQSAFDQIAGGEANKVLGAAIARGMGSIAELNKHYARLNFLTKEGQAGAVQYARSFSDLQFTLSSLSREGFGLLGVAMAPAIAGLTEFLVANQDIIRTGMQETIVEMGTALEGIDWSETATSAQLMAEGLGEVVSKVGDLVEMAGGIQNVAIGLGGLWVADKVFKFGAAIASVTAAVGGLKGAAKGAYQSRLVLLVLLLQYRLSTLFAAPLN